MGWVFLGWVCAGAEWVGVLPGLAGGYALGFCQACLASWMPGWAVTHSGFLYFGGWALAHSGGLLTLAWAWADSLALYHWWGNGQRLALQPGWWAGQGLVIQPGWWSGHLGDFLWGVAALLALLSHLV